MAFLPEMAGWKHEAPHGETVRERTSISRVQVDYEKGESQLSFELMDIVGSKEMIAEAKAQMKPGFAEKRGDGYTKAITIGEFPGTEEWTPEAKNGYIALLVADRYVLKVTGSYVPNVATIRSAIEAVDLQKLAALK